MTRTTQSTSEGADSPQREFAVEVVRKLRDAGHQALWAGGCVRDALLGHAPKDYDVATSALPDQVRAVFGKRRTLAIGAAFGVITVLGPKRAGQIEVATFRTDANYADGRRPEGVVFSDPEHDASRRDFTINGLFFDPIEERVIDYVGGQRDLADGVVRAIGAAEERLHEDKLRMLRAVRFTASLGFVMEASTQDAIQRHAKEITIVSAERIGAELRRMLTHANRAVAMQLLRDVNLLTPVLPEVGELSEEQFAERCSVLSRLDSPALPLCLAAALPPGTASPAGSELAQRLKFTNDDAKQTDWLLDHKSLASRADTAPWPQVQRMLIHPGAADLVALREAELDGADDAGRFCRDKLSLTPEMLNPPPLVTGGDLIAVGFRPGPGFGKLLDQIRDEQLEGRLTSKSEAIRFANLARSPNNDS